MRRRNWVGIVLSAILIASTIFVLWPRVEVKADRSIISISNKAGYAPGDEVISARTLTSKTTYLGGTSYALDSGIGNVHYRDSQGNLQNIDNQIIATTPQEAPWSWKTTGQAGYQTWFGNRFNAGMIAKFQVGAENVQFQPFNLDWINDTPGNNGQTAGVKGSPTSVVTNPVVSLMGNTTTHQGTITWDSAYGTGTHFSWINSNTVLCKQLKIDSLSNLLAPSSGTLSGANPCLRLNMIFLPSSGVNIFVDGSQWDKLTKRTTFNYIEFRNLQGQVLFCFDPLMYWDSAGNSAQSVATLRWTGAYLIIEVRVPYPWLQTAVYPIYIDTNVDVQVGATANDGYVDGFFSTFSNASNALLVGNDFWNSGPGYNYNVNAFYRFPGITIPQYSTINIAYISLYEQNSESNPKTAIFAEDANNPNAVANYGDYATRTLTSNSVEWDNDPGGNDWYNSDSIVSIIQELVTSFGYSNQAIQILHKNNGTPTGSSIRRSSRSYDNTTSPTHTWGAKLHIEYSSGTPSLSNTPTSKDFGTVLASTTYYALGSAWAHDPLEDSDCTFTITNDGSIAIDVAISATNFTGGGGWTLGAPDGTHARLTVAYSGQAASGLVLTTSNQAWISNLAASGTKKWDFKFETPTSFADGNPKTSVLTLTASVH